MNNFSDELSWSLSASNTSTAVTLLSAVWPAYSWVTTCQTTDQAGVDLLGYRDGRQPLRVDLKFRRVSDARRKFFDPEDIDGVFDIWYASSDGQNRPGPVKRYDGNLRPCPADYYLFVYPAETPPVALLVNAPQAHAWLADYYVAIKSHTVSTVYSDGLTWLTTFAPVPASLLNARAASNTAWVLTVANGRVTITLP